MADTILYPNNADANLQFDIYPEMRGNRLIINPQPTLRTQIQNADPGTIYVIATTGDRYLYERTMGSDFTYDFLPGAKFTSVVLKPAPPISGRGGLTNPNV